MVILQIYVMKFYLKDCPWKLLSLALSVLIYANRIKQSYRQTTVQSVQVKIKTGRFKQRYVDGSPKIRSF